MSVSESVRYRIIYVKFWIGSSYNKKIKNDEKKGAVFLTNSSYSSHVPFTMLKVRRRSAKKRVMEPVVLPGVLAHMLYICLAVVFS